MGVKLLGVKLLFRAFRPSVKLFGVKLLFQLKSVKLLKIMLNSSAARRRRENFEILRSSKHDLQREIAHRRREIFGI